GGPDPDPGLRSRHHVPIGPVDLVPRDAPLPDHQGRPGPALRCDQSATTPGIMACSVKLSIVIPLHDDEELIPELLTRLRAVVDGLDRECEVVLVDDGSTDGSWQLLRSAADGDGRIRAILLSRNFGHQVALSAGLRMA